MSHSHSSSPTFVIQPSDSSVPISSPIDHVPEPVVSLSPLPSHTSQSITAIIPDHI